MELYYTENVKENYLILKDDDFRHCTKVLRNIVGDTVNATDGKGNLYSGTISEIFKNELKVNITNKTYHQNKEKFNLVIAPTKNSERIEWLVEKAVEIGIKSISFIICEHSERKNINLERLEKIAISAMKQSNKNWKPDINEPIKFKKFIENNINGGYIAHCYSGAKLLFKPENIKEDCLILIGPEGDFSQAEVKLALENDYKEVSLGESRLRTETAGLYALCIYKIFSQIK